MILATGLALRTVAVIGGVGIGVVAVRLAQVVPPKMENPVPARPHGPVWWATAVAVATGFGWFAAAGAGGWALLPAYLGFGATTLAVTLTDIDHQLIPNRILFPGLAGSGLLLVGGALVNSEPGRLMDAAIAAMGYFTFLLVVAIVARGGFGMGDVKLALLLGLFLGYAGWDSLGVGLTLAILLGGVASVLLLLFTRKGRKAKFAYGPFLVAGAWIGLFWGSHVADWYLNSGG